MQIYDWSETTFGFRNRTPFLLDDTKPLPRLPLEGGIGLFVSIVVRDKGS